MKRSHDTEPIQFVIDHLAPPLRDRRARQLQAAIDHARQNLGDRITVRDMADSAGMSEFHFAREFRAATGQTPRRFLMMARLERVRSLLALGAASVAVIALMAGFASQAHLTKQFKARYGVTPGQYQRSGRPG